MLYLGLLILFWSGVFFYEAWSTGKESLSVFLFFFFARRVEGLSLVYFSLAKLRVFTKDESVLDEEEETAKRKCPGFSDSFALI